MELLDFPITVDFGEPIYIHVFSDIHREAAGCDSAAFRNDISKLKARVEKGEQHFWLVGGDVTNSIIPGDRRFDSEAIAPEFQEHIADDLFNVVGTKLYRELEPIRDQGIGICTGNHEQTIAKRLSYNISKTLARDLNLPYLGYSAIIRFRLRMKGASQHVSTCLFYWHHGRGAARTAGAKLNMLIAQRHIIVADVYGVGHVHELVDLPKGILRVNRRGDLRMDFRPQLFFNSGCYLKNYTLGKGAQVAGEFNQDAKVTIDWAETMGFEPSVVGHNGFVMKVKQDNRVLNGKRTRDWRVECKKVAF